MSYFFDICHVWRCTCLDALTANREILGIWPKKSETTWDWSTEHAELTIKNQGFTYEQKNGIFPQFSGETLRENRLVSGHPWTEIFTCPANTWICWHQKRECVATNDGGPWPGKCQLSKKAKQANPPTCWNWTTTRRWMTRERGGASYWGASKATV